MITGNIDDIIADAWPDETEFIVMTKAEWDKVLRYLKGVGLPRSLESLEVLTVETDPK